MMRQALTITYPITAKEFSGLIRKAKDGRVRQRLMAMNFIAQGHTIPQVATRLDIAERPLRKWLHRFNAQGPEGLKDAYRSGQPPKLTNEVIEQFKSRVRQGVTGNGWGGLARLTRPSNTGKCLNPIIAAVFAGVKSDRTDLASVATAKIEQSVLSNRGKFGICRR